MKKTTSLNLSIKLSQINGYPDDILHTKYVIFQVRSALYFCGNLLQGIGHIDVDLNLPDHTILFAIILIRWLRQVNCVRSYCDFSVDNSSGLRLRFSQQSKSDSFGKLLEQFQFRMKEISTSIYKFKCILLNCVVDDGPTFYH